MVRDSIENSSKPLLGVVCCARVLIVIALSLLVLSPSSVFKLSEMSVACHAAPALAWIFQCQG